MSNHKIIYLLGFLLLLIFAVPNVSIGQPDICRDILSDGIFDDKHSVMLQSELEISSNYDN